MTYQGIVNNGVVVLPQGHSLPEGAEVYVQVKQIDADAQTQTSESIWKRLAQLGQETESLPCDLPDDLAANHDHYLHGLAKRK